MTFSADCFEFFCEICVGSLISVSYFFWVAFKNSLGDKSYDLVFMKQSEEPLCERYDMGDCVPAGLCYFIISSSHHFLLLSKTLFKNG